MKKGFSIWVVVFFGCLVFFTLTGCFSIPVDRTFSNQNAGVNEQSKLTAWGTFNHEQGAIINSINGKSVNIYLKTPYVLIAPGSHILEMSYYAKRRDIVGNVIITSPTPIIVTVEFIPGHYYLVIGDDSYGYFRQYMAKNTYCIGIIDITEPKNPKLVWSNDPDTAAHIMESGISSANGVSAMNGTWSTQKERFDKFVAKNKLK